jgi:hypothetical protein
MSKHRERFVAKNIEKLVVPAEAGIHPEIQMDSRFRGNDG